MVLIEQQVTLISLVSSSTFVADFETEPEYLPAMEMHGRLKMLLDTLMDKQAPSSWQIYEGGNGSVVVKIRFAARIAMPL